MAVRILHGDCLDLLPDLPDACVDAVVTDPPYELGFMGRAWDASGIAYNVGLWRQVLRVVKPGGHLLAFGGSRTFHRLACAIEDAGWEIRDSVGVLGWVYGSGFPKSLDVSKAIDARAQVNDETRRRIAAAAEVIRRYREAASLTRQQVSEAVVGTPSGACWNWEHHQLPSVEMWPAIKAVLGIPDTFDGLIEGDRAQFIAAEREVIGERVTGIGTGRGAVAYIGDSDDRSVTAPATDDARRWAGWGTALKPAWESIVYARKPPGLAGILAEIGSHLDRLEATCQALAKDRTTPTGVAAGSADQTDTSPYGSATHTSWNIVSSWRECWADLCALASTSTTETMSSTTTDLRTLSSCLAQITPESITPGHSPTSGSWSLVEAADNLFAAAVTRSRAILALSVAESATEHTPTSPQGRVGQARPAWEPVILARRPLAGTVAANVLAHGTGALNVEACRVEANGRPLRQPGGDVTRRDTMGGGAMSSSRAVGTTDAGRWPTNVVLCHAPLLDDDGQPVGDACEAGCVPGCPVADMDAQSGTTITRSSPLRRNTALGIMNDDGWQPRSTAGTRYPGEGGASRFFPVFRYAAKAPTRERPKVNGVAHPTVKPLALMRWLCRLVTPPGGTVLDPFAGSGATVEAAMLEGFSALAIEREADYLPLIDHRLQRAGLLAEESA